jgi:hypothetical protein
MAIWQFSVYLIPCSWAEEHEFDSESLFNKDEFSTKSIWDSVQLEDNFQERIERVLPKAESWSDELLLWGDQEKNDIQIWFKERIDEGILVRIDLRKDPMIFIREIVQLAQYLDCAFFFPELRVISESTETKIIEAIRKSAPFKFVKDPYGFIEKISKN